MITIEQRKSAKCPGLTSLFVSSTQYSEALVNVLQNLSFRIYDKNTKEWETGITFLAELITILSQFDDINLKLLDDYKISDKKFELTKIKTDLFDYQKDAVQYGLNHDKWLLLDAPGLGKTLTIISLANELRVQGKIKKCLIICGINALKINWKKEIEKHSDLSCRVLGQYKTKKGEIKIGGVPERLEQLKNPIDEFITITNIETIRDDKIIKELTNKKAKNKFDLIVLDECHKCLSYDSLIETDIGLLKIGDICTNRIMCNVKSMTTCGNVVYKPIIDFHTVKNFSNLIKLTIEDDNKNIVTLECTPDHKIFTTNRGWVEAMYLTDSDDIKLDR